VQVGTSEHYVRNRVSIAIGLGAIAVLLAVWTQAGPGLPGYVSRAFKPAAEGRSALNSEDNASGRLPVACPPAGNRTMVALIFGQSHAANVVKERFVGDIKVFNYFQGHCYRAADPLLGTDNGGGNVWTLVGNELVRQRLYDAVVLVTIGVSGSYIGQWAPGGRLHAHLLEAANSVGPGLSFTHVFVQQGESDLMAGTPAEEYFARFDKLHHGATAERNQRADLRRNRVRLLRRRGDAANAGQSHRIRPEARDRGP
jgi:Carbohydrate esterase, sialic acid-specific acetylesterase